MRQLVMSYVIFGKVAEGDGGPYDKLKVFVLESHK